MSDDRQGRPRLEDQRGVRVGDVRLWLTPGSNVPIAASFHHHANQGSWHTVNCLLGFAGLRRDPAADVVIGMLEWWRTVESLVSLLHLVAIRESEAGMRTLQARIDPNKRPDVGDRWAAVAHWFSEGSESPPAILTTLMTELRDFRNSFEHATRTSPVRINRSRLSDRPDTVNESDLMEAMAICIAICDYWREVILGCDLMPQVHVPSWHFSSFFDGLDVVAVGALWPIYQDVVSRLGLRTDVTSYDLEISRFRGRSLLPATFLIAYENIPPIPDSEKSAGAEALVLLDQFASSRPHRPGLGLFGVPNYSTNPAPPPGEPD